MAQHDIYVQNAHLETLLVAVVQAINPTLKPRIINMELELLKQSLPSCAEYGVSPDELNSLWKIIYLLLTKEVTDTAILPFLSNHDIVTRCRATFLCNG